MENTGDIQSSWARLHFSELMNDVAYNRKRVRVTRRGHLGGVAVVPLEDLELLEALEDRLDRKDVLKALKEVEAGDYVSQAELEKELGL
ncbi:MAG: type II toxin-antitoxin system prevent-host-death family antitoxin [Thermodesulfobacteriota bacterium]